MRSVRTLCGIVGLLGLISVATGCSSAAASQAAAWIEVTPNSVQPGAQVSVRASCGDNSHSSTVTSSVFGTVTVSPVSGVLLTQVQIPPTTPPGTRDVKLTCVNGQTASTTLTVLAMTPTANPVTPPPPFQVLGPNTGGGFLANGASSRTPLMWIGAGLVALIAAVVVGTTSQRRSRVASRSRR